jgi:hypothetical protein
MHGSCPIYIRNLFGKFGTMRFTNLTTFSSPVDANYIHDELYLAIKEIQFHYSIQKAKAIKREEAVNFNHAVYVFFNSIDITDEYHLSYIGQKLRLTDLSKKEIYLSELLQNLKKDEEKIAPSTVDFRLRAILYIYRFYHNGLKEEIKNEILTGLTPLLKYIQ